MEGFLEKSRREAQTRGLAVLFVVPCSAGFFTASLGLLGFFFSFPSKLCFNYKARSSLVFSL